MTAAPHPLAAPLVALALLTAARAVPDGPPRVALPESPAARAVAADPDAGTAARPLVAPPRWPASLEAEAWETEAPWLAWAETLAAARAANDPAERSAHRADLALLAAVQGRDGDAWRHLAACSGPDARAVLPHLFPGVPLDLDPTAPLPDGVRLAPLLPPPPHELSPGELVPARVVAEGVRVGDAVLRVALELARDGVQVDLEHVAGGTARLELVLPEPEHWAVRVDYLDWQRRETPGRPHALELAPGRGEPLSSWGRFAPRRTATPGTATLPPGFDALLERRGIAIEAPAERRALAAGLAAALGRLFATDTRVVEPGSVPRAGATASPLRLRLAAGPDGLAALCTWISRAEGLALGA